MPRFAALAARPLALALALALAAAPTAAALAQTQGAPSTPNTTPRTLPGTGGPNAVPDHGQASNAGADRGPTNDPNAGHSGAGGRVKFSTGPLQGGGGPNGAASDVPPAR